MITTPQEYCQNLWLIQHNNFPRKAILGFAEKFYDVDLKTRTINSPEFLSVLKDHKAESIYFSVPRYVDYMDLSQTACIIQYKLANGASGIYSVPFYDITTLNQPGNERLILPWLLDGHATSVSGPIEYSIRFFLVNENGTKFLYNLNTLPATSKVLYGMDVVHDDLAGQFNYDPTNYETLLNKIMQAQQQDIYWIEMR